MAPVSSLVGLPAPLVSGAPWSPNQMIFSLLRVNFQLISSPHMLTGLFLQHGMLTVMQSSLHATFEGHLISNFLVLCESGYGSAEALLHVALLLTGRIKRGPRRGTEGPVLPPVLHDCAPQEGGTFGISAHQADGPSD